MGTKVFLVRHGETDWNRISRFQGTKDIKLNDKGKKQAKRLANRFKDKKLSGIYSSDLSRAHETALIIAEKHDLKVEKKPGLKEINFGVWEGLTFEDLQIEYEEEFNKWKQDPIKNNPPGGETLKELQERAVEDLEDIISRHQEKEVLVVSHGGTIRTLVSTFLEIPLIRNWHITQDNTAVNILNFFEEGAVTLELLNCTAHLY